MEVEEYVVGLMWSKSSGKGQAHGNMIGTAVPMEEEMIMHTCAKAHSGHPRSQSYSEREKDVQKVPVYSSKAQPLTSKFAVVASNTTYPMWVEAHVLPLGGYILETRIYVPSGILCKELREVLYFKMPTLVYTTPSMAYLAHAAYFEEQLPCAFCARTKSQSVLENEYDQLERSEQEQASFALFQPCACQSSLLPNGSPYKIPDAQTLKQYGSKHSPAYRWRQFIKWAFQGLLFRPFHQSIVYAMETGTRPLRSDTCDTSKLRKTRMQIEQMFIRSGSSLLTELMEDLGKHWAGYLPVPEPQSEREPLMDQQPAKRQHVEHQHDQHESVALQEALGAGSNPPLASASPQRNSNKAVGKKVNGKSNATALQAGAGNKKMSPKSKQHASPTSSMENGKAGKKANANTNAITNGKLGKKGKKMMGKKRKAPEEPAARTQGVLSKKQRTTSKSSLGKSAVDASLPASTEEAVASDRGRGDFSSPVSLENGATSKNLAIVDIAISKKSSTNSATATAAVERSGKKASNAFEVVRDSSISSVAS